MVPVGLLAKDEKGEIEWLKIKLSTVQGDGGQIYATPGCTASVD